jgi:hypothetical protein
VKDLGLWAGEPSEKSIETILIVGGTPNRSRLVLPIQQKTFFVPFLYLGKPLPAHVVGLKHRECHFFVPPLAMGKPLLPRAFPIASTGNPPLRSHCRHWLSGIQGSVFSLKMDHRLLIARMKENVFSGLKGLFLSLRLLKPKQE